MTVAERISEYYEHDDFKDNYAIHLLEDTHAVQQRIKNLCKEKHGEVSEHYGGHVWLTDDQAEEIYEYILDNMIDFLATFNNYYVGDTSIDSISYGEQEEQLTGLYNHKTGKPYTLPYLKQAFDDAGYVVNGDYAYMDLSGSGLHIDLLNADIPMLRDWIKK